MMYNSSIMLNNNSIHRVIQAKSFTPYYSAYEDRIRVVINYTDYDSRIDLWLTRAFLLKLFPTVEEVMLRYRAHISSPTIAQAHSSGPNAVSSPTDTGSLTLMEQEGVLIESVDITYKSEIEKYELCFKTKSVHAVTLLDAKTLQLLMESLIKAAPTLEWGISLHWL
jgi:hypothetical protein